MANAYTISGTNLTVANAAVTLAIIRAATAVSSRGSLLEVDSVRVSQYQATPTSAMQRILLAQKASAFGTYVSVTPAPALIGGPASAIAGGTSNAAATCGMNASAEGAGTVTNIVADGFNVLNGWVWVPTPEERIILLPDTTFIVKFDVAPSVLTGWGFTVAFRELN